MRLLRFIFSLSVLFAPAVWAASGDEFFNNAREAYKARDEVALSLYVQQLQAQNYVLAPYTDYWLMLLRLSQADNATVRDFINRYSDLPFADRVRGEWLKALGKRQDWPTFFAELPNLQREDVAVSCYAYEGRASMGDLEGLSQAKSLWLTSAEQPANCAPVFERMIKANVLTQDDLWAKFRLAMQDNKMSMAKAVLVKLGSYDANQIKLIDKVYENPQKILEKKQISLQTRLGRELNLYALERMAKTQPDYAMDFFKQMQWSYEAADRNYIWGRFALHAARRHDPAALEYFSKAQDTQLDKEQYAWRARAALLDKNWGELQSAINSMPVTMQAEAAWRYWLGRALKEQKQVPAANAILSPLSRERSYYGLLAEEELGDSVASIPSSYKPSDAEVNTIRAMPAIQRSLELQRLDLRWESRTEWAWATKNFDDKQMLAAAELAARMEWYDLAIITAEKTAFMHDFSLRYPTPYREYMQAFSREQGLDEAWVYGLTRQESRFVTYAKSGVGAAGLMQVMPATAQWIAKRMGLSSYHPGMINQLDTNIQLGTYYLRHVLDQMGGQSLMATAAYNAGPSRAKRWAAGKTTEGAIYAETIPFSETRNYVQKVMGNAHFYAQRLGAKMQTLKQRLGFIAPNQNSVMTTEENE